MLFSKKMNIFNKTVALFVFSIFFMNAHAQEAKIGNLKIEGAYVRSTVPGQKSAAGFMKIISQSNSDQLIAASSTISDEVQLHTMTVEGDTMRMRQVNGIEIPVNSVVELKPGGLHLMLVGIKSALKVGSNIKVKLKFAKAGEIELNVPVANGSEHTSYSHDHMMMK